MNANSKNLGKADVSLREAIEQADPGQTLQAVVDLDPVDGTTRGASKQLTPGEFGSRDEYRQAMINRREAELAEKLGPTLQSLRELGLEVKGGRLGRTVVLKGAASDLLASLDLPAVRQATLDQPFGLGQDKPGKKRRKKGR
jgi:hypothetical protein